MGKIMGIGNTGVVKNSRPPASTVLNQKIKLLNPFS
jgi:hypothetical protein